MTVDLEARALGLGDLVRLDALAKPAGELDRGRDVEVPWLRGDRDRAVVVDPKDLKRGQIDEDDQPVDGVRPLAVARVRPQEGDAAGEPARFTRVSEVASRPGVDLDGVEVRDAAFGERLLDSRIKLDQLLGFRELLDHGQGLHVVQPAPVDDGGGRQVDGEFVRGGVLAVEQDHVREPFTGPRFERRLVGLAQIDGDEPRAGRHRLELLRGKHRLLSGRDLGGCQRVERVRGAHA